jgi:hypothetical protein
MDQIDGLLRVYGEYDKDVAFGIKGLLTVHSM